jgi:hypothetical protein
MKWSEDDLKKYQERQRGFTQGKNTTEVIQGEPQSNSKGVTVKSGAKQTKAEIEYGRMLAFEFPEAEIIPWGVTLRMMNGHKYTPDYLVNGTGWMLLVEVKQRGKNGFRQHSYQRAKVAFDQCRVEFPNFTWRWSEKQNGTWNEHKY